MKRALYAEYIKKLVNPRKFLSAEDVLRVDSVGCRRMNGRANDGLES